MTASVIFSREMSFDIYDNSVRRARNLLLEIEKLDANVNLSVLDPSDPFFLYRYTIDKPEFERIKHLQELLIPFESLAAMLVDLLTNLATSKFSLAIYNLTPNSLTLKIIEPKEYKNLAHLTFEIPVANEQVRALSIRQTYQQIKLENEQLGKTKTLLLQENEALKRERDNKFQTLMSGFEIEKVGLHHRLNEVENKSNRLENINADLLSKTNKLTEELAAKDELLESKTRSFSQQIGELQTAHFQQLKRKESRIEDLEKLILDLQKQVRASGEEKEKALKELAEAERELETTKADLNKANQIIGKLQEEVKSSYDKLGALNQVAKKQEKIVDRKDFTVEKLAQDLKLCLHQLKLKDHELERVLRELELAQSKIKSLGTAANNPSQVVPPSKLIPNGVQNNNNNKKEVVHIKNTVQTYLDELERRTQDIRLARNHNNN